MQFFTWLETTGLSTWIRESECVCAYDLFLASHAIGMAAVVGLSTAVALRVLGFSPHLPLAPMEKFFPFMYAGFWLNAASGLLLFVAYPTRAMTNPAFYLKLGGVVLALVCLRRLRHRVFGRPAEPRIAPVPMNARVLAGALLFAWWDAIVAGRLLAYQGIANVERETAFAVITATAMMLLCGYAAFRLHHGTAS